MAVPWMGCASVMLEQVRNDSRLAPSSLLLGKARERSLLSLNRKVVNSELFCSLRRIPSSDCFTTLATGYRYRETGELVGDGTGGHSWSASSLTPDHFQVGSLWFGSDYMGALNSTHRSHALSVRCVQASAQKLSFLRMHAPGPGVFPSSSETFSFSVQPSVRRMDRLSINRSKIC